MRKPVQGVQRPAEAPHWTPPLQKQTQRKRGGAMGWNNGKRIGLPDSGKTWPESHLAWEMERGGERPPAWRKPPGGIVREWEGGSIFRRSPTPP